MKNISALFFCLIISYSPLFSQIPFNLNPNWISSSPRGYSTGCGWADINNDGWMDLVISNGNDMEQGKIMVFFNSNGTLSLNAGWQSNDLDYHGHLSVGDINNDGFPDIAVSVYIGQQGFTSRGKVKIYINNAGTLNQTPYWISGDSLYTFSCAFGDSDNDGDLDLAVASGESYNNYAEQLRIYRNNNGVFESLPYWKSSGSFYSYDVSWADINNDGRLDLVFGCDKSPNKIFLNYGDSIGRTPYWTCSDTSKANTIFLADINNDNNIDLAVSDNNQNGGAGRFKIYLNTGTTLSTTPFWTSAFSGAGSGLALADVDFDGWKDLICGGWWKPCYIYKNQNGTFQTTPQWTSTKTSVVEAIAFCDYDMDGIDTLTSTYTGNGTRKLYYLFRTPVYKILQVKFGSNILPLTDYCYNLENGWITFKNTPLASTIITVKYLASHDLDFAVSNWDPTDGNFLYKNNSASHIINISTGIPDKFELRQNYPNPFNPSTNIIYKIAKNCFVSLKVFDQIGREIETIVNQNQKAGIYEVQFTGEQVATVQLPSGIYFYSLFADGERIDTKKFVLLK